MINTPPLDQRGLRERMNLRQCWDQETGLAQKIKVEISNGQELEKGRGTAAIYWILLVATSSAGL